MPQTPPQSKINHDEAARNIVDVGLDSCITSKLKTWRHHLCVTFPNSVARLRLWVWFSVPFLESRRKALHSAHREIDLFSFKEDAEVTALHSKPAQGIEPETFRLQV
eukprot:5900394-Amphidinium_carterae.1